MRVFGGYVLICFSLALSDNPSQVSRVLVAIETLDLNDNAPELDRQYNTAMCDSSSIGQVSMCLNYLRSLFPFHSSVYKMFILKTWKDTKTHVKETSRVITGTTFWHYTFLSLGTWTASSAKDCNFSRRCEKTLSDDYTAAAAAVLSFCLHVWRSWFFEVSEPNTQSLQLHG